MPNELKVIQTEETIHHKDEDGHIHKLVTIHRSDFNEHTEDDHKKIHTVYRIKTIHLHRPNTLSDKTEISSFKIYDHNVALARAEEAAAKIIDYEAKLKEINDLYYDIRDLIETADEVTP